jgi:hypothetical protein
METGLKEKGNFCLFAANRKQKWPTSICFFAANRSFFSLVGKRETTIDVCFFSKRAHLWYLAIQLAQFLNVFLLRNRVHSCTRLRVSRHFD